MAGRAGRTYKRDGRGRFASTGTSGKKSRPPAKTVAKGPNKLTRDNSGKITSVGGNGATARGGRLRTASGNLRATQTTRIAGGRAGMVGKGGKVKGSKVLPTTRLTDNSRVPASQRPGSMTNTLRSVMGSLAKQDAKRIREVEAITGQKVRATRSNVGTAASNRVKATGAGSKSVSQTLRAGLRELAQSDARTMRGMAEIVRNSTPKLPGGKKAVGGGKAKALGATAKASINTANGSTRNVRKVDLSQSAFEARAKQTERRARAAEKAVAGADRGYASPGTKRLFRTADALRSAADSYSSYARRGQKGEFSAGYLFTVEKKSSRRTTAPKLTRVEKAARTRAANAEKKFQEQRRRMEQARRYS